MRRAETLHRSGDHRGALALLSSAKATCRPVAGVDTLRAKCFAALGDRLSAEQARREESRWSAPDRAAVVARDLGLDAVVDDDEWFGRVRAIVGPYTMLSERRLRSLHDLARSVLQARVGGDFVECGVAAGGSSALLAACIRRYGAKQHVWCFDSFCGMPKAGAEDRDKDGRHADDTGWGAGTCAAPVESLLAVGEALGAADRLIVRPGLFQETLAQSAPRIGRIALLHLDGDWYESTRVALEALWSSVAPDGAVQIDDYGHWEGCRRACDEFFARRGVRAALERIDYTGVALRVPNGATT